MNRPARHRTARRAGVAALAGIGLVGASAGPALAAAAGRAVAPHSVTSGSWGAQAGAVGQAVVVGTPYVVTFNEGTTGIGPRYLSVTNTGNRALTGQTYTAVNSKPTTGNAPPSVALDACVGASWNTLLGTCLGTVLRLTSSTVGATTVVVSLPVRGVLSVRAAPETIANFPNPYQTTITIAVSRAQAGVAAVTHS